MTKAILCLVCVWGAGWAVSYDQIDKKYADFDKEMAKTEAVQPEVSPESTPEIAPETTPEIIPEITPEVTPEIVTADTADVQSVTKANDVVEIKDTVEAENTEFEDIADNAIEDESGDSSDVAQASQFDEKEELSAADTDTLAVIHLPEGDSSNIQTLDFSAWVNPACRPVPTTSAYKIRRGRLHRGVDVKVYTGDSIVAAAPGKVIISKYNRGGYGHYIVLQHENGTQTVYGHLSKRLKKVGERAESGELIGLGGNTGRSTGSHLHFEIRYGDINIDPATVINFDEGTLLPNVDQFSIADATASHKAIQKELSKHRVHRIRKGDTLGKLARKYGTTIERICKLNKINRNSILRIGRLIQIS